jgi:cytochrome d ubiquinol oxidase subunit II
MINECLQPYIGTIWISILALVFLTYLVLDGLVSGIGILSFWIRDQELLKEMTESFSGVWHTHQTWLVVFAGLLFGAFPTVFGRVLSVLYLPVSLFILGLVVRGVALELMELKEPRRLWTFFFALGSMILTLSQAMVVVLTLQIISYSAFGKFPSSFWVSNVFTFGLTLTLIFSFLLFGLTYLINKTSGDAQDLFYTLARKVAMFLIVAAIGIIVALSIPTPQHPVILYAAFGSTLIISLLLFRCLLQGKERPLFPLAVLCFVALFVALLSTYPGLIQAVSSLPLFIASARSQAMLLIFFCLMLSVCVIYNVFQYRVFRGKVDDINDRNY